MTRTKILSFLTALGPTTTEQMIAMVGKSYAAVHTSLRRLTRAGLVVENADGTWALATNSAVVVTPVKPIASPAFFVPPPPPPKKLVNHFIILLDRSGSMNSVRREALDGVNKTLRDITKAAEESRQETRVSLYDFADYVNRPFFERPTQMVEQLYSYYPNGGTALFDAVERAINDHLVPQSQYEDHSFVVIAITDGQDNGSRDKTGRTMNELVRRVQGTDRWTVTFQLPPNHKAPFCRHFSVPEGNVTEWEATRQGVERATVQRDLGTQAYFAGRSVGVNSTKSFYEKVTTDLSKLNTNTLRQTLTNIAGQVKTWQVDREEDIQPFVQRQLGNVPYIPGTAFYQLTKTEARVQPYKKVLLMEKGSRAVYGGDEARRLIGLKDGATCRVIPGNHSNFDIFIQSTSNNRKLVRGTKVVHYPNAR